MKITDDDAAFVLGKGGATKRKIARVSGAKLEIHDLKSVGASSEMEGAEIEITGTPAARQRAKDYIGYVLSQRTGPVYIDHTMRGDDLSIVMVPMDCVGYVMGRGGQVLRDMENEWGTLMFFAKKKEDEGKDASADGEKVQEILAIFGTRRSRRGAELKVMSAVEHKMPGHFLDGESLRVPLDQPGDGEDDDFDYDVFPFRGDEFSYALGGRGSTRKKIASAANCILEYVGQVAFLAGNERQRGQCRDYLDWLLKQKEGEFTWTSPGGTTSRPSRCRPSRLATSPDTRARGPGRRGVHQDLLLHQRQTPAPTTAPTAMNDAEKDAGTATKKRTTARVPRTTPRRQRASLEPRRNPGSTTTRSSSYSATTGTIARGEEDDHGQGSRPRARHAAAAAAEERAGTIARPRRAIPRPGPRRHRGGQRRRFDSRDRARPSGSRQIPRQGGGDRGGGGGGRDRSHELCRDYSKGRCNRGSDCRFRHVDN